MDQRGPTDGSGVDPPSTRPLRRDAQRNRRRILDAARSLIATHGLGVSYEEVARAADVAVGTVYNRFPRREDLIDVLFTEQVDEVVATAQRVRAIEDPWDALVACLTEIVALQVRNRGLRQLAAGTGRRADLTRDARERIAPVVTELLERAQEAGAVRPDVRERDLALVPIMVGAVIDSARHVDANLWRRALVLVLDGLRAGTGPGLGTGSALPDEEPGGDRFDRILDGLEPSDPPRR